MNQQLASVVSCEQVLCGVHLMEIESPEMAASARPGQFVMISCDSGYGRLLRRPLSVHHKTDSTISLLFAVVGNGTAWLAGRKGGDKVDILGPLGNGFMIVPDARHLLLVAGGMGVAPLWFLAQEATKEGRQVTLLAGAASAGQLYNSQGLPASAEVICCTEDGTAGQKGLVTSLLPQYANQADQIFACGPTAMYRTMLDKHRTSLQGKSVQVSLELRMGCGLGFCYACTFRTRQGLKQVCKDGPVFNLADIIEEELM